MDRSRTRRERGFRARAYRASLATAALTMLGAALAVLAAPAAAARLADESTVGTGPTTEPVNGSGPLLLASTGLDITVPILVGLGALILGTALVGWAFLATGRRGRHG